MKLKKQLIKLTAFLLNDIHFRAKQTKLVHFYNVGCYVF